MTALPLWLQAPDQDLVDAVIDSLLEEPLEVIEESGEEVQVVEMDPLRAHWNIPPESVLGGAIGRWQ